MELQIDDVSRTYADGTQAVKGMSLTISEGAVGLRAALAGCKSPLHSTGSSTTGLVQGAIFAPSVLALAIRPKINIPDSKLA